MAMNPWIKWGLVAVLCIGILFVSALGGGVWLITSRMSPDIEIGQALPPIELVDFDGEPVGLESYRGRVVVLDFWSSW